MGLAIKNKLRIIYDQNEREEERKINELIQENKLKYRIYHIHIRKTAGTTINHAFLSTVTDDADKLYRSMGRKSNHRIIKNNTVFVGWNRHLINRGRYFFGFSHEPLHKLDLSSKIAKITCLRDPVKRVISHYNMLQYFKLNNIRHTCMKTEGKWLGKTFHDFLDNIPKKHLHNQLYMFSKSFSVEEAAKNILDCYFYMFTEELDDHIQQLEQKLNLELPIAHEKKFGHYEEIPQSGKDRLREMMQEEYDMIELINTTN
ncbi:MAG: sulfotransferase family 2 domain-containing protein [Bacteroidetes bacterium]|jgi:hypothetical protein|nr:sulfotransferase family 2 domain-containing protein [Bacteroidota bacterium]